jgi:hypothetical protein
VHPLSRREGDARSRRPIVDFLIVRVRGRAKCCLAPTECRRHHGLVTHRPLLWMRVGWLIVLLLSASLTAFTAIDRGGGWWVPWIFAGIAIVAAGNLAWLAQRARR